MKQFITIILLSIFISSCTSNTIYKKPENLISKDQMVDLLVDMQLALGAKSVKNKDGKRKIEYMYLVYEKYGIDSTQFSESNFYYTTNIDDYNKILKKVKKRLDVMKENFELEQVQKDSLNRASKPVLNERPPTEKSKKFKIDTSFVK
ncbi:MAG: DUF4296 domain-containing protein [Flavobacteriaceae bacterium]|nr:DUF4296 domain-containing protein [Flavobacteriaceae bacterium]